MTEPAISIKNLLYRYRGEKEYALQEISLQIEKGSYLAVMGPTEAGKSTLASCFNGLIPHFHKGKLKGDVTVFNRNTRRYSVARMAEQVGLVFQDFESQLFSTNVELEIAFGPENFGLSRKEITRRIKQNLAYIGFESFRNRSPATLSGGQKQKLAIASVLAMNPKLMVMDEPTSDLDPFSSQEVIKIMDQLRQRDELTLIVIEHDLEEVLHADNILLIKEGRIVDYASAKELLKKVDLFEQLGIRPHGVAKYFKALGAHELPLTIEAGIKSFWENHWKLSEQKYNQIKNKENDQQKGEVLIQTINLEHCYSNNFKALKEINLEIRKGEITAIIGQNGGGKTTLVKHMNGLLMPTKGKIEINGRSTKELGIFKIGQKVGYVFQNPDHQIFAETVFDEVAFTLRLRKKNKKIIANQVEEALAAVGLSGIEGEDPHSLTKSGRQRVAVASVLAARPDVLILDEPTTGLDYSEQYTMMNMIRELNQKGSTIIFITHHMWVVAEYAHSVYVVKDGGIFLQGTPREIFAQEEKLKEANLRPPLHVSFANRLGKTLLTLDELIFCTEKGPFLGGERNLS